MIPNDPQKRKVLDIHCHTAGFGYGGSDCFLSAEMQRSWRINLFLKAFDVTRDELKQQGDRFIIRKITSQITQSASVDEAVILALDGVIDKNGLLDRKNTQIHIPGSFIARETAQYKNLHYGASVNPYRPNAIEEIQQAVSNGAVLMKWIPSIMQIDPSDRSLILFYKELSARNLPLLTHTGNEKLFRHAHDRLCDPNLLELPLQNGVTVIAAHLAATGKSRGMDNTDRLLFMMEKYPNLYADISSLTQINKIRYLKKALKLPDIQNRLIYGTDFPLINTVLCHPAYYIPTIGLTKTVRLIRIQNPWDRDVFLKKRLGIPAAVFSRSWELLIARQLNNSMPTP